jgi:FAD/FMN-containing dehydrogenase
VPSLVDNLLTAPSFVLTGGLGPLSGVHGLAADNLLAATVVLASGEIVTCTNEDRADVCRLHPAAHSQAHSN